MRRGTSKFIRFGVVAVLVTGFFVVLQFSGGMEWVQRALVVLPGKIVAPIRGGAVAVRHGLSNVFALRTLYVENAELQSRVSSLEGRIAELSGLEVENEMLKSSLGFAARPPVAIVPCSVAGRDPEGLTQTLLLSCGAKDGVAVGQGVVSEGYLIGKVILVTNSTTTVRLLTAATTVVDVRIAGRGVSGVLKGSFGSGLVVDLIPQTAELAKGDLITTAGINDRVPPDILVGSVLDLVKEPGALFYKITVTSPVDLRDLRYVHVLKP